MIPNDAHLLSEELAQEEASERHMEERQAMIEADATELMKAGNECYPFTLSNLQEALSQASKFDFISFTASLSTYHKCHNQYTKGFIATNIAVEAEKISVDYWQKVALYLAEQRRK